jgi:hypothetical protein
LALATVVVTTIASYVGSALAPYLLLEHPLVLLLLSPVGRHVALAAPRVALLPLVAVVVVRRVVSLAAAWALGAIYGSSAVSWLDSRSPRSGAVVRLGERLFGRWGTPLLLVLPTHLLCALAGASGTRPVTMLVLVTLGEIAWTIAAHRLGGAISGWTGPLVSFVSDHLLATTLVSAAVIAIWLWVSHQRRGV